MDLSFRFTEAIKYKKKKEEGKLLRRFRCFNCQLHLSRISTSGLKLSKGWGMWLSISILNSNPNQKHSKTTKKKQLNVF